MPPKTNEEWRDKYPLNTFKGETRAELERLIEEAVAEALPKKGTALDTVTKWIKKFPRETILTVVSSNTGLVITKTPPTRELLD